MEAKNLLDSGAYTKPRKEIDFVEHGIIAWIIIGVLAGWITGKLMKGQASVSLWT